MKSTATAILADYSCSAMKWLLNFQNLLTTNLNSRAILFVSLCPRIIPLPDALESIRYNGGGLVIDVILLGTIAILKLCMLRSIHHKKSHSPLLRRHAIVIYHSKYKSPFNFHPYQIKNQNTKHSRL